MTDASSRPKPVNSRFQSMTVEGSVSEYASDLGPCRMWTAGKTKQGYGAYRPNGPKLVLAHRYAYELFIGEIPEGHVIDHLCRVRACVNPDHLEAVTNVVNLQRGAGYALRNGMRDKCINGHDYTEENTYIEPNGIDIRCRACARERERSRVRDYGAPPQIPRPIDINRVRELHEQGMGAGRIRAVLRVSQDRLYRAMDEAGIPRRPRGGVQGEAA